MSTWTYPGTVSPLADSGKPDDGAKTQAFPGLAMGTYAGGVLPQIGQQGLIGTVGTGTNAAWWRDFALYCEQEFARRAKMQPNITNIWCAANNGAGDANGIGTLQVILVTS